MALAADAAPHSEPNDQGLLYGRSVQDLDRHPWNAPTIDRCFSRHAKDYARLSATPDHVAAFCAAVGLMQKTQPNYSADDLARTRVPVTVVQSEHDEFIKREHAE